MFYYYYYLSNPLHVICPSHISTAHPLHAIYPSPYVSSSHHTIRHLHIPLHLNHQPSNDDSQLSYTTVESSPVFYTLLLLCNYPLPSTTVPFTCMLHQNKMVANARSRPPFWRMLRIGWLTSYLHFLTWRLRHLNDLNQACNMRALK